MPQFEPLANAAVAGLPPHASRREFLRLAAALGGLVALAACDDDDDTPTGPGNEVAALDFGQPLDVLRYAFVLEALEADFYSRVATDSAFATTFPQADERTILTDIRDHEVAHREFLRAAIGAASGQVPQVTFQYPQSINFAERDQVLATARTFEDLGVAAYNGAARYLVSRPDLLGLAGKVVSVEARHASVIRDLIAPNTEAFAAVRELPNASDADGLDGLARPNNVLEAVQPFVVGRFTVTNL